MSRNSPRPRRLDHALDTLWYFIKAPQVTAALFALLALVLGLAAIFPQVPAGLEDTEIDRWLTTTAGRYPGTGMFLRSVDAFNLLGSAWARALLAALALNLTLRIAAQVDFLRGLRRPQALPLPPARVIRRRATLQGPLEGTIARLREALAPYETVMIESDATRAQVFAQRRPVGAWGPLLTQAGLLLLLAGLVVDGAIGWRAADITLAPGNATTLNRPGALQITLRDVVGTGAAARANLTLALDGRSRSIQPGLARPVRWGNLWLSQQATSPALTVTGIDGNRRSLVLQSLEPGSEVGPAVSVLFPRTESEQGFALPGRNLTFRAVSYTALPDQGIAGPVFLVEAYRDEEATPAAVELVEDEGSLILDDIVLTLRRDRYAVLEAAYLPGLLPMLLGGLLALAGITITCYGGMARIWAHLALDGTQVLAIIAAAGPAAPQAEIERLLQTLHAPNAAPEAPDAI